MNTIPKLILTVTLFSLSFSAYSQSAVDLNQTMMQACSDSEEGDLCSFTNDKGESINGQCRRSGSPDGKLRCVPTN